MKAILEQNFDELYAQAKERIETCVKPMEQMTTFAFFMMWNTINQILFDVFHETRFMWNIVGTETDNELKIRFQDQLKEVATNDLSVLIRNEFKLISFEEFRRMTHKEMCKYVDLCRSRGYSSRDLARHFGKTKSYVSNRYYQNFETSIIRFGEESMIARETLKRMHHESIPLIALNSIF